MKSVGILLSCSLAVFGAANDSFLIRNVDVYPVTGKDMPGVSVLVQDGKIADIGAKIAAPKGIRVIEGKGLRVYPGMIDSATNLGLEEISAVRESVDTAEIGEFMPQLRALSAVNPESEHFGVVRVNGITSAITLPGSMGGRGGSRQYISGMGALIHLAGYTWEEMEVSRTAALHLAFPAMGGRGGRGGMPAEVAEMFGEAASTANARRAYDEAVKKITDFFEEARRYKTAKAAHVAGLKPDLKFEAMIPVLDGKTPVAVSAPSAEAIHDAVKFADAQHIKIVIMGPKEIGNVGPELKQRNIPVVLGRVLALPQREDDSYDDAMTLAARFYKAGVKFAFGTFTNQFVRNLPFEAANAVAFGLPADEALKAVTINAAEIWRVADKVGSVERGKVADLLVTNGDPLDVRTKIAHLYIKGQEIPLTNKQTRLYEKYLSRP